MAETETIIEEKKPVVASVGKVQRANGFQQAAEKVVDEKAAKTGEENTGEGATQTGDQAAAKTGEQATGAAGETKPPAEVEFTEEQKKAFFKKLGVDYNGEDDIELIKNKLKPAEAEPTEEEKRKTAVAAEMKLVDLYVKNGGTLEQFNSIKTIANANPEEVSKKVAIMDLVKMGLSEEEAKGIASEMYYQNLLDNIEQEVDENDKDFEERKKALQKKVDLGNKILQSKAASIQKDAADVIKGLQEAIEQSELQRKQEATFLSNVDKTLSGLPRKQTFELGKVNDLEIPPVLHEVSEDSVKQVAEILKDPAKRNQFFYNQDNTLNLQNLTPILIDHFEKKRAIKNALLEGQSRQVAEYEKIFPAKTGYELGVGGAAKTNANGKGQIASSGKPERVRSQK